VFFERTKIERAMDGEPGFAEHGCESKPDRQKKENSLCTPAAGVSFLLDTFLWTSKEKYLVPVGTKKE